MSSPPEANVSLLLQYSYSYISDVQVDVSPEVEEQLRKVLHDFITGEVTYDAARDFYVKTLHSDIPVQVAHDILNVSDSPIDQPEDLPESIEETSGRKKTRTWTGYEDQRLVAGIFRFGFDSWIRVANFVGGGRTRAQCAQRWTRGLNPKICKKGWTPEEDSQLLNYVRIYGNKSWAKIAHILGNRSDVQCRYHYLQLTNEMKTSSGYLPLSRSNRTYTNSGILPGGLLNPPMTGSQMAISSQIQFPAHLLSAPHLGDLLGPSPQQAFMIQQPMRQQMAPQPIQPQPQPMQPPPQQMVQPPMQHVQPQRQVTVQPVQCWDFKSNQPGDLDSFLNQMNGKY
ncbi:Myb-like DNA-binding domain containing protein [Trichomonas vaginalis G3]|uniref:Myb-like DNA-binding domain containing protein n=1 Tax=Trichomonas vaginalis (strain ATCC PRA-98 / G3) TaxID=412133 RepID=A2FT53_TRIV3|nr:RNA polymerase II transcription regulator recruiting protein [Trichomonas vaginalis G3]EAX91929.1 Myb-like DNA-binding domain containing protein [Trichomonas vaginalis G3]KAI5496913.1 RNA polymerase II transcription regulator recruiting protein [Trichomonas vaginalis G3]|eukprot:XP_001304859.1 Myb-like DNA-binding domain containing protein [Trichomonas vaginalis G3]